MIVLRAMPRNVLMPPDFPTHALARLSSAYLYRLELISNLIHQ